MKFFIYDDNKMQSVRRSGWGSLFHQLKNEAEKISPLLDFWWSRGYTEFHSYSYVYVKAIWNLFSPKLTLRNNNQFGWWNVDRMGRDSPPQWGAKWGENKLMILFRRQLLLIDNKMPINWCAVYFVESEASKDQLNTHSSTCHPIPLQYRGEGRNRNIRSGIYIEVLLFICSVISLILKLSPRTAEPF